MAETGVWAPCESPAHAASMAASTSDADLMVTVGDRVVVVAKQRLELRFPYVSKKI